MKSPKVSVVVSTYRRAARLPALVKAIEAQTLERDEFELVIADNGSPDETPAVLEDIAASTTISFRTLRVEVNRGPGPARNLGWRASLAPIVAFTDDDCVPSPGWLEAGLSRLRASSAGIVQGRTLPDPDAPAGRWAVTQQIERFSFRYETCNIFYRRDVLEGAGGFDESLPPIGDNPPWGEDTVLGWTARRQGIAAEFEPAAVVYHAVAYPGRDYFKRWARQHAGWATLVKRFPEMREDVLWLRVFTKRRHAALIGAVAALAGGAVWAPALSLAIPYVWHQRPRSFTRDEIVDRFLATAFDVSVVASLVRGSLNERTLVL